MKEYFKKIVVKELGFCARLIYTRFRPFVIGITGSSGKTTTRYMVGELFSGFSDDLMISQENLNSEFGLPLALLGYGAAPKNIFSWCWVVVSSPCKAFMKLRFPKYLVLEYAADKPGDIHYLISLVPPDVAVITNIGVAHMAAFKNVDNITKEKWEIASAADKVITTKQVAEKVKTLAPVRGDLIIVGSSKTVMAYGVKDCKNKTEFSLQIDGVHYKDLEIPFIGAHNMEDLLLAIAAVFSVSGDAKRIVKNISKLTPMEGRGRRFSSGGAIIIDESYNANPASMIAALSNLKRVGFARKVAILGEMKELGRITKRSHSEVAKIAKTISDLTIGVGDGFRQEGLDKWYSSAAQLIKDLDLIIKNDDTVLVKGSHSVGLDRVIKKLEEKK